MKTFAKIRTLWFAITASLISVGYAASQWFYFNGRSAEYARMVDTPAITSLALVLFLGFLAMPFIPLREGEAS